MWKQEITFLFKLNHAYLHKMFHEVKHSKLGTKNDPDWGVRYLGAIMFQIGKKTFF